jgi:hypothetical protein
MANRTPALWRRRAVDTVHRAPTVAGMSIAWHVQFPDGEEGPFDSAGMRALVVEGRITPATLVRRTGMPRWVAAANVRGLLPEQAPRAASVAPVVAPTGPDNPFAASSAPMTRQRTIGQPRRVVYGSGRTLAIIAIALHALSVIATLWLDHGATAVMAADDARVPDVRSEIVLASVVLLVLLVALIVVWCLWTYRVVKNSYALGAKHLDCTPGWAVGSFFIPILNLFRPCQAISQAWTWSGMPGRHGRLDRSGGWLVITWWVTWMGLGTLINMVGKVVDKGTIFGGHPPAIIAFAVNLAAIILAVLVLWRLTARQDRKAAALAAGEISPPQPAMPRRRPATAPVAAP